MSALAAFRDMTRRFLDMDDDEQIFFAAPNQPIFSYVRAQSALRRTRVLAMVFMLLVPLWIVVDTAVFPRAIAGQLAVARLGTSVLFCMLALYTLMIGRSARWPHAYLGLLTLMLIPTAFGLYVMSEIRFWTSHANTLDPLQSVAVELYLQLPVIYVAGIALFPLSLLESLPLVALMAALALAQGTVGLADQTVPAESLAGAWIVLLAGSAISVGSLMHLQAAWRMFCTRQFDPTTQLLTRESALSLLKLSWKRAGVQDAAVGMVRIHAPKAGAVEAVGAKMTERAVDGMFGVRWSQDCLGYIRLRQEGPAFQLALNRLASSAGCHPDPVITDSAVENCKTPLELVMCTEERLKKALAGART